MLKMFHRSLSLFLSFPSFFSIAHTHHIDEHSPLPEHPRRLPHRRGWHAAEAERPAGAHAVEPPPSLSREGPVSEGAVVHEGVHAGLGIQDLKHVGGRVWKKERGK